MFGRDDETVRTGTAVRRVWRDRGGEVRSEVVHNMYLGTSLDSFLDEEGIRVEVNEKALANLRELMFEKDQNMRRLRGSFWARLKFLFKGEA